MGPFSTPFILHYALVVWKHMERARRIRHLKSNFQKLGPKAEQRNAFTRRVLPANRYWQKSCPLVRQPGLNSQSHRNQFTHSAGV